MKGQVKVELCPLIFRAELLNNTQTWSWAAYIFPSTTRSSGKCIRIPYALKLLLINLANIFCPSSHHHSVQDLYCESGFTLPLLYSCLVYLRLLSTNDESVCAPEAIEYFSISQRFLLHSANNVVVFHCPAGADNIVLSTRSPYLGLNYSSCING